MPRNRVNNAIDAILGKKQEASGVTEETTQQYVARISKEIPKQKRNANAVKTARVSRLAVYSTVQFTFVRTGNTVFLKQSTFNAKRLGMKVSDGTLITKKVVRNGVETSQPVSQKLAMTKPVKISLGRAPKKRSAPTKGGRAIRGGGKTVGGGLTQFAKTWVTIMVPKGATGTDIIAYVGSFSKPVYEVAWNGKSIPLLEYKDGLAGGKGAGNTKAG